MTRTNRIAHKHFLYEFGGNKISNIMLKFLAVLTIVIVSIVNAQPVSSSASDETVTFDSFEIIKLIAKGSKQLKKEILFIQSLKMK